MALFCDTPGQSLVAGVAGGVLGGLLGATLGLDVVGVALLAGLLGGAGDVGAHLLRGDRQFRAAVWRLRNR